MAESSAQLHESLQSLDEETIDRHRAIVSLMEELEAMDWYDQRQRASKNPELRAILIHNRNEEKEHAAMALEWLRRHDPELDRYLRRFLFTEGNIAQIAELEEHSEHEPRSQQTRASNSTNDGSLGIRSLRGE